MQSALVYNSGSKKGQRVPQQSKAPSNATNLPNTQYVIAKSRESGKTGKNNVPSLSLEAREHPYLSMLHDPQNAPPALPPVVLPSRAVAFRVYQEVMLTTDASGNAGVRVSPRANGLFSTVATWTNNVPTTFNNFSLSSYTSFAANFQGFIPTCLDVTAKYTGAMQSTSGRFYGMAGVPGNVATNDVGGFPVEYFGCETIAADGASCTWYSTSPVWNNPQPTTLSTDPTEWGDTMIVLALIGGPASSANLVTVGITLTVVGFPKAGVIGVVPTNPFPDTNASLVAGLMAAANSGFASGSMSATEREKHRRKKIRLRDVLRVGGRVLGTMAPLMGPGADAASLLSSLLV